MISDMLPIQKLIFSQDNNPNSSYKDELVTFSLDQNWLLWARTKENRANIVPYSLTWLTSGKETKIIYVEDYIVDFPYLIVDGQEIESISKLIKSHFDIYSQAEIVQQAQTARTEKEQVEAIFRLALIAPNKFDSKFFELFQIGFNHPSPEVRAKTLKACAYTEWKEFIPCVEKIRNQDSDEIVRNEAEIIFKAYESQGIS